MILKNSDYAALAENVKSENRKIIVYGAGMIGQTIVPYLVKEYDLYDYVDCFIDMDKGKTGQFVKIGNRAYEIKTPDYLYKKYEGLVLLITNSKFFPVVRFLDQIEALNAAEGYVIPIMQIDKIEQAKSIEITRQYEKPLIPKIIHYCWFGEKTLPDFLKKCIWSWREMCPDYRIVEWNEKNYNVNKHKYTKEAFEKGKYSFVTDVARLDILYENGGIYLDTDVTLLKNLDDCLYQQGFVGVEKWGNINTGGGCGFVKGHPMLKKMIDYRNQFSFVKEDGSFNIETNGMYETKPFLEAGFKPDNSLQVIDGITVYPSYVNHPYDYMSCEIHKKAATVSIHHFYGNWMEKDDRLDRKNTQNEYTSILERIKNKSV